MDAAREIEKTIEACVEIIEGRKPRIRILNKCGMQYYYVVYQPGFSSPKTSHAIAFCHRMNLDYTHLWPEVVA